MKCKLLAIFALAGLVSACGTADPQAAQERRDARIAAIYPDPADRTGIYLAFPLESFGFMSTVEVVYAPDEVTENAVISRTSKHCAKYAERSNVSGQAYVRKRGNDGTRTDENGQERAVRQVFLTCITPT